ncbi:hypothetical protein MRX96_045924 [Rhipicephalus microplus]
MGACSQSLYASMPALVSESLRWASLVSLGVGWTEAVHRPLPVSSKGRSMTLMDGVFTLFNVGSSVTAIRQGVYMIKEKHKLFDICPRITRTAAASFASSAVLVTLSIVSAWRNKRGQPCSAYIWSILGLLATAAIIDAMASAQHLWTSDRMVLSDFNYQNGVILVNIFSVFFLLGSFLSTGLRDRVIFKSHHLKSRERGHDDTSSPLGIFVCWPLRTHLANVVLRSKVIMKDVPLLPHRYKCGLLLQQLSNHLSEGWHKTMTTGRFVATILRVLWIDVMWTVVSTLGYFGSVIIKVPILESLIEAPDNWNRATSATLFAAASVADLLFCSYQTHVSLRLCARVRSMLQAAIFSKMTRLSPSALTRNPSGYVVSVLGVDCVQLSASALQFPLPIIGSLCMPVVLWVLALRAGTVPAVGCALWLMIVLFLPFPTSVLQNILWKRVMRFRDERLKSTADLLSSVRVVKLYAWEDAYLGTVGRLRDAELAALLRTNLLDGLMDSLYSSTSSLLTIILFGLLAAVGGTRTLTPTLSFSCLYLLSLTDMITNMMANTMRMRSLVSLGLSRICKFCTEEEQEERPQDSKDPAIQKGEVMLSECSFSWTQHSSHTSSPVPSEAALRNITFRAAPGSLVGVVGFVGSGKSSLLAAILGDMHRTRGVLRTSGSIAYVSQVAAIYNMTVRDNITFGKRFDPGLYVRVIKACELLNDLNSFPAGDLTEVGEKGETLSGGQKQRISLARAVYSCSKIYLLDDPLSALDATTRILVCNQGSLLKHMDLLLLMHSGTASVFTSVSELLQHKDTPRTVRAADSRQAKGRQTAAKRREQRSRATKGPPLKRPRELSPDCDATVANADVSSAADKEIEGVLMFDEMSVRKSLHVRESDMALLGKVDLAEHTKPTDQVKDGDHVLVFLFRPFLGGWSQTVGAFCTSGAAPGSTVAKLILQCIVLLSNAGVIVEAVTCDNSTSNRSALNSLGVSGDVTRVSTSFEHPCDSSKVIQAIIDPPHIFKCIRNNLLKAGKFLLPGDKEVQHSHFEALLDYEEQQAGLRAVPKLTKAHISPNAFQKLSVRLAVQLATLDKTTSRDDKNTLDQDEAKGRVTVEDAITSSKTAMEVAIALGRFSGVCGPLALLCFVASAGAVAWQQLYVKEWTDAMVAGAASSTNWVGGLVAISLSDVLFRTAGGFLLAASSQRLSRLMHRSMLEHLLASPVSFFDSTSRGRILARFSLDLDAMDSRLFLGAKQSLQNAFITIAKLVVVGTQTPPVLAVGAVAIVVMSYAMKCSIQASNAGRYLESRHVSRMLQHVTETRDSLSTVRCLGAVPRFRRHYERLSDLGLRAFSTFSMCFRFSRFAAGSCGLLVVLAALALSVALAGRDASPEASSSVGLALSSSLSIPMMTVALCLSLYVVLQVTVSFERDLEYTELPAEVDVEKRAADQGDSGDSLLVATATLDDSWPSKGLVEFEKYSASYRPGTLPDVLKGVTFVVEPHEKVGVVGRTGAGKSSLVLALLRVLRASRGRILIDGVDVSTVPLRKLRSAITVIPQDPSLVRGSLRDNLDPTRSHSDAQLWTALRQVHLSDTVAGRHEGLLLETGDGGSNLSVGQRQLVCLARALLRGPKILVLDEATSQMDGDTDRLIQATLRDAFAECTVIAIAHRIHTVLDYDKILVMSEGTVLEYGPVKTLLSDTTSAFYAMARNAGALPFDVQCPDIAASAGR